MTESTLPGPSGAPPLHEQGEKGRPLAGPGPLEAAGAKEKVCWEDPGTARLRARKAGHESVSFTEAKCGVLWGAAWARCEGCQVA